MIFLWGWLATLALAGVAQRLDTEKDLALPGYLNEDLFRKEINQKLTLVEFFSPYCHHCKDFYPTWEQTYKEFHDEMEELGVSMRQVDCVESGDLCMQQEVFFYPNLRLYGPSGTKGKYLQSFPRMLGKTPENIKNFLREAYSEFNSGIEFKSLSKELNATEIKLLTTGEFDKSWFVTLFPSSNEQWRHTEKSEKDKFDNCPDCLDYKLTWDRLSNQIQSRFNAGHINCLDHTDLCAELGFKERSKTPKFKYFLPKSVGLNTLEYKEEISLKNMKLHSDKLFENSQYEKITSGGIPDLLDYRPGLFHKPIKQSYPLRNKIAIVYYYDDAQDNEEDRKILPKILDLINDSPFNLYLYTAKHKKIDRDVREQAENMIKYINYNDKTEYKFDELQYLTKTATKKPTLLILRENTLITPVYQTFDSADINDFKKVKKFILENQYPLYQELTPSLLSAYFTKDEEFKDNKVVISFIDSTDIKGTNEALYNISLAAHEYNHLKKQYLDEEKSLSKALRNADDNRLDVVKKIQLEIPKLYDNKDVLFTYIDLKQLGQFVDLYNWKIGDDFEAGDSIVLSKDFQNLWKSDIGNEKLKTDPQVLTQLLKSFIDSEESIVEVQPIRVNNGLFSFSINYNYAGFMLIVVSLVTIKKLTRGRKTSKQAGIIGNLPKKD